MPTIKPISRKSAQIMRMINRQMVLSKKSTRTYWPELSGGYGMAEIFYRSHFVNPPGSSSAYKAFDPGRAVEPARLQYKILSVGYYDAQTKQYTAQQNANAITPVTTNNEISYAGAFADIDLRHACEPDA